MFVCVSKFLYFLQNSIYIYIYFLQKKRIFDGLKRKIIFRGNFGGFKNCAENFSKIEQYQIFAITNVNTVRLSNFQST